MKKLVSTVLTEYENRLLDELKESKIVKTSISVDKKDLCFIDSVAEHFDTTRTDIVAHIIHSSITDFIEELPIDSLKGVLALAIKKDPTWKSVLTTVENNQKESK
jgi:hypothetical protein